MKWLMAGIIGFFIVIMALTWIAAERAAPVQLPAPSGASAMGT